MSDGIWTPGQQQQAQLGFNINDLGGPVQLAITSGSLTVVIPLGAVEHLNGISDIILAGAEKVRATRAEAARCVNVPSGLGGVLTG